MIESIEFVNFKALRNTTLPLAPFTLLLGPNGSGKSSVLQAIQGIAAIISQHKQNIAQISTSDLQNGAWVATPSAMALDSPVKLTLHIRQQNALGSVAFEWPPKANHLKFDPQVNQEDGQVISGSSFKALLEWLARMQTYTLDPAAIASPALVHSGPLAWNGGGLVAVLDDLKDNFPEKWESLLAELREWLPEYDHIQFTKPTNGIKGIALRTKRGSHRIPADQLSQGTLVALALLTLAYLPNPPSLIGLEEIDRGLHPRLLGHLQDALYRLSYPVSCGEKQRPPIQVITTTHSPYLLDLYREHPEEVVLAEKEGLEVQFKQLSKIEHFDEILGEGPLSEIWYSGVLGGVSVKP